MAVLLRSIIWRSLALVVSIALQIAAADRCTVADALRRWSKPDLPGRVAAGIGLRLEDRCGRSRACVITMVVWAALHAVVDLVRTLRSEHEMSTYTATIRWTRDRATATSPRASTAARTNGRSTAALIVPASPSPHIVPGAVERPGGRRSRGGVRRLAVVLPHAVLRRLRAARRVRGRQLCRRGRRRAGEARRREDGDDPRHLAPAHRLGGEAARRRAQIADLHHRAHEACFIANRVTTEVTIDPNPSSRMRESRFLSPAKQRPPSPRDDGEYNETRPPQPCRRRDAVDRAEPRALPRRCSAPSRTASRSTCPRRACASASSIRPTARSS